METSEKVIRMKSMGHYISATLWVIAFGLTLIAISGCGCGCGVRVKHHWGFMGPDTWEATDGKVSVYYYAGDCLEPERVIRNLVRDTNRSDSQIDWSRMNDKDYSNLVMLGRCKHAVEEKCQEDKNK